MSASDRVDGFYKITFEGERCIGYRRMRYDQEFGPYEIWRVVKSGGRIASTDDLPDEAIGERIEL